MFSLRNTWRWGWRKLQRASHLPKPRSFLGRRDCLDFLTARFAPGALCIQVLQQEPSSRSPEGSAQARQNEHHLPPCAEQPQSLCLAGRPLQKLGAWPLLEALEDTDSVSHIPSVRTCCGVRWAQVAQ